jgi:hypothetical protein
MKLDRIIVRIKSEKAKEMMTRLYKPIKIG